MRAADGIRSTQWLPRWRSRKPAAGFSRAARKASERSRWPSAARRGPRDGAATAIGGLPGLPHFAPKAKRCIYLHLVGAPAADGDLRLQAEDEGWFDKDLPESIRQGQRLTTMTSGQTRFPIAPSIFKFAQHGKSGAWVSELLPYTARMVDDIAIIRSMHTEAINHEPAITFFQTGFDDRGPALHRLLAQLRTGQHEPGSARRSSCCRPSTIIPKANVQAISARLWSAGFLSGQYSGVGLRSSGDPVLFINNPDGVPTAVRRRHARCALAR